MTRVHLNSLQVCCVNRKADFGAVGRFGTVVPERVEFTIPAAILKIFAVAAETVLSTSPPSTPIVGLWKKSMRRIRERRADVTADGASCRGSLDTRCGCPLI
jgi:hypothetical protein